MKVKFTKVHPKYLNIKTYISLTLNKVYDCSQISLWKSAYIMDDNGVSTCLFSGEYEVISYEV